MRPPPETLGGARVLRWSAIDDRHRTTGACRHVVAGAPAGPPAAVAICADEASGGFLLFGCDAEWRTITDTWHETIERACAQAEREFPGVAATWP